MRRAVSERIAAASHLFYRLSFSLSFPRRLRARLEKHPSVRPLARRGYELRVTCGDIRSRRCHACEARFSLRPLRHGVFSARGEFHRCVSTTHVRAAVDARAVRSPATIRHRAAFMEASAINQRNLLPRLAVDFLRRPRDHRPPPPLSPSSPIDALSATLPRRPSRRTSFLSSFSLAPFHPFCAFLRTFARDQRDSARARFAPISPGAIARKARVFHTFLLVSAPGYRARSRRARDGALRESRRQLRRDPTGFLHNTYFMRDAARGNSE